MISIQHLLQNPAIYTKELEKRFMESSLVEKLADTYKSWREKQNQLDSLRQQKNEFNNVVVQLQGEEKQVKIQEMKKVSEQIKALEAETKALKEEVDKKLSRIPNLTSDKTPIGQSDADNVLIQVWGTKPEFDFAPKPYWELPVYQKCVGQEEGVKVMGSRGFGSIPILQIALRLEVWGYTNKACLRRLARSPRFSDFV